MNIPLYTTYSPQERQVVQNELMQWLDEDYVQEISLEEIQKMRREEQGDEKAWFISANVKTARKTVPME